MDYKINRRRKLMLRTSLLLRRRLYRRIPNFFTLSNAIFGLAAIIFAGSGDVIPAAYCILFGAIFDALDGRVARLLGITSALGGELDSLSDAITFCLAPAVLVYQWELYNLGFLGFIVSSLFLIAGLVRLARFNITKSDQTIYFLGVPTTIAGCFIATLILLVEVYGYVDYRIDLIALLVFVLAYLMISSVRFPTFKHISRWWYLFSSFIFMASMAVFGFFAVLFCVLIGYFLLAFYEALRLHFLVKKNARQRVRKAV